MARDISENIEFSSFFEHLADLVNQLSDEERDQARHAIGEYTHDLKHTLGLITSANALMTRTALKDGNSDMDMLEIINTASKTMNTYFDMLVEHFSNRIAD